MVLARPSLLRPLTVVVSPLAASGSPEGAAVILFVSDPEVRITPSERLLSSLYGLTAAEAALAARLLEGQEVSEAAQSLRIGLPTARTHLSRILAKTGTRRQAELLRLLLRGPVGLDYGNG
jgi:DNA-binding CsgD family transcriptional regulator